MENIYRMELPVPFATETVNVYLIKAEKLILIDTGTKTEETLQSLNQQLGELGYRLSDIDTVIITHHHADHCGLLDYFREDVEVVGHPWNTPWITQNPEFIQGYQHFFEEIASQFGIPEATFKKGPSITHTLIYSCHRPLTHEVQEGDFIHVLPEFQVIETPGHASTHIALYRERDGLLIGGDLLLDRISSNPLLEPPYHEQKERAKPLLQYNESLRRIAGMPISRIITGHGKDVTNIPDLVEERLKKQEVRALKVLEMLKEKPMTAYEVCVKLFPAIYDKQLALTISETVGQLDFLEYNQQVMIDSSSKHWIYYVK
jgi:glyoxylase-like metal-dependent hydrolase (beta-lactamase superfamily II)